MYEKIPGKILLNAGIEIMERAGTSIKKVQSKGRSMIFSQPDGQTVRIRTCNDHILLVVAESPDIESPVNIEGTDQLLVVMPETERTPGKIIAFLVPTEVAIRDAREGYRSWIESNPRTKGNNTTRALWFDRDDTKASHGFMKRWQTYLLPVDFHISSENSKIDTISVPRTEHDSTAENTGSRLRAVVEEARRTIAEAAGTDPASVRITIEMN